MVAKFFIVYDVLHFWGTLRQNRPNTKVNEDGHDGAVSDDVGDGDGDDDYIDDDVDDGDDDKEQLKSRKKSIIKNGKDNNKTKLGLQSLILTFF